jgi:spermidine dehydrogenase
MEQFMDDETLGLNQQIVRRDYLYGSLLTEGTTSSEASPAELLARKSRFDGRASYVVAHTPASEKDGLVAIGQADAKNARDTGEVFDLVVIGAGLSGLAAAHRFHRLRSRQAGILLLENHNMFGGNARRDEFEVGHSKLYAPQASTVIQDLSPALSPTDAAATMFKELNIDLDRLRVPVEQYFFGAFCDEKSHGIPAQWFPNIFAVPLSEQIKKDQALFFGSLMKFYEDPNWRRKLAEMDRITFRNYIRDQHWTDELFGVMVPELSAFFGFPETLSAGTVYSHYASQGPRYIYAFPGGNSGLARYLVKDLIPPGIVGGSAQEDILNGAIVPAALDRPGQLVRLRLGATAVQVEHPGNPDSADHVAVSFIHKGQLLRVRAKGVIMASGGFVTRQIVADMPEDQRKAYSEFVYAPILWVNVVLNNSRALEKAGLNLLSTYWNGFGGLLLRYEKIAAPPSPEQDRPAVLGVGCPRFYFGLSAREQEKKAQDELMHTAFREYERRIREDLVRLLGPWGFDPRRDIEAIVMHRWSQHGYVFGYSGFSTNGVVERARRPYGRIAFAHTDLHKFSLVMGAVDQGYRAAQEIAERIGREKPVGASEGIS